MKNIYNVLIIEDEQNIAEFHSMFLRKHSKRLNPIGIAHTISEAQEMVKILKPDLILLDNYLPDGKGLEILTTLLALKSPPDFILITAASDTETIQTAVRSGAFDYLLKPVSYDRLGNSLDRYIQYRTSLEARDFASQRYVDQLLNFQSNALEPTKLPKGIDELALRKVKDFFENEFDVVKIDAVIQKLGISKTTARRYLEYCISSGYLEPVINYGKVGRPVRLYKRKRQ